MAAALVWLRPSRVAPLPAALQQRAIRFLPVLMRSMCTRALFVSKKSQYHHSSAVCVGVRGVQHLWPPLKQGTICR